MDFYFQTFKATDSAYIKNISCIVNESLNAESSSSISIYDLDVNGNPNNWVGYSNNIFDFTTIPRYYNFEFDPYILINANTDYAIVFSFETLNSFPNPAPPPNRVYLWYNTSNTYPDGYMGYCSGRFPPVYTHYLTNDFPFKINYSWLYYDTETYPFLFAFDPPKNDNIYRMSSIGSNTTFTGATEIINDVHDIEFLYVEKGGFVPDDNWLNLEGLSIESDLLFLGIALSLWIFFVSKYLDNRDKTNSLMFAYVQLGFMFPLDLILADFFILRYPFFFVMVLLIPILSIYLVVDSIYYQKKNKR
jgi:hypothetical protein